jgi:enoyl-CoA hydratase
MAPSEPAELVGYALDGPVATLTLQHPPVNVLSRDVLRRLLDRLAEAVADEGCHVVILASAFPKAFAAGANIREMAPMGPSEALVHGTLGQAVARAIERCPLPVIAAVNGVALGGGCEIALACDFVLASEEAKFGQPEINLGIAPGWGGTQRLVRRVGASRARRWILTGEIVPAADAYAQGWVDRVVPAAELGDAARGLATQLAQKGPLALAACKYAINEAIDRQLDDGLAYELGLWARLFATADQKAGMNAFLEKRSFGGGTRANWSKASEGFPWASSPAPRKKGGSAPRRSRARRKKT